MGRNSGLDKFIAGRLRMNIRMLEVLKPAAIPCKTQRMKVPLRVLHLEDNRSYSELVQVKLEEDGFKPEMTCVETQEAFEAALTQKDFDLIIADYHLPTYDGISALKLAQRE